MRTLIRSRKFLLCISLVAAVAVITAIGCATAGKKEPSKKGSSAQEQVNTFLKDWRAAWEAKNSDKIIAMASENIEMALRSPGGAAKAGMPAKGAGPGAAKAGGPEEQGKTGLKNVVSAMSAGGPVSMAFDSTLTPTITSDTATVKGMKLTTPRGTRDVVLTLKKQSNGQWLATSMKAVEAQ